MPRKATGETKTSEIRVKQKNGDIYVYERKYKYNPETQNNHCLGDTLKYKITDGEIKNTRPRKKVENNSNLEISAIKTRIGATEILNHIGEKSGIDQALYDVADIGDARKIISIARYLVCTGGHTLPAIQEWQLTHSLPYDDGITQDIYGKLFEQIGLNYNLIQNYFKKRINWCDTELLIAYDSTTQSTYSKKQDNARYGFNKEGNNLPTIKFLVLYSIKDKQPIAYTREPGNLPDVTSMSNAIKQLKALGVKIAEVVTDNGYYSEKNLGELLFEKLDFITLVKTSLSWVKKAIDENYDEFNKESNYCTNSFNMSGIVVPITKEFVHICQKSDKRTGIKKGDEINFEKKIYLHLYLNEDKRLEENKKFRKEITEIMNMINDGTSLDELNDTTRKKAEKYLKISKKRGGKILVQLNDDEMNKANKYRGFMALVTNREKNTKNCIEKYRLREKIEENFQIFKDDCDSNRIRNWYDESYQGKLFVQFVAMGYYDYLYSEINRIKKEIDDYISSDNSDSKELIIYRNLKTWLHDMSLERLLSWFDVVEETVVSSNLKRKYWTTETTKRDNLFFKLLGIENI